MIAFNVLIKKTTLLNLLESKITEEAVQLIHHLQISSYNYDMCWDFFYIRADKRASDSPDGQ